MRLLLALLAPLPFRRFAAAAVAAAVAATVAAALTSAVAASDPILPELGADL